VHPLFITVLCIILAGCAIGGTPRLEPQTPIARAEQALQGASAAGVSEAHSPHFSEARRKLAEAKRLSTENAERSRRLAEAAAADARLAEALLRQEQIHRAEMRLNASVDEMRRRLQAHGI